MPPPYAPQQVRKVLAVRREGKDQRESVEIGGRASPLADETTEAAEVVAADGYYATVAPTPALARSRFSTLGTRVVSGRR
ncbi:hypothetical protein E2562_037085 [Oryza meyeriana var. granulata]|uniref:Uncharacterized protein n=1 Tax=Oryza meyeriana var. granulata TaxID=110450 RepID=A0A6G1CLJ2_9ORYZ|nr:hypothetical protein E2562_037085 [Oryza meyeriana var. granulata]